MEVKKIYKKEFSKWEELAVKAPVPTNPYLKYVMKTTSPHQNVMIGRWRWDDMVFDGQHYLTPNGSMPRKASDENGMITIELTDLVPVKWKEDADYFAPFLVTTFYEDQKINTISSIEGSETLEVLTELLHYQFAIPTSIDLKTDNGKIFRRLGSFSKNLIKVSGMNTSKGTVFKEMFFSSSDLEEVTTIDTSNATDTTDMFKECNKLVHPNKLEQTLITDVKGKYEYDGSHGKFTATNGDIYIDGVKQ